MKGFERNDRWISLCGLNCGLCSMKIGGYCPGCGGGEGNQGCSIARCAMGRGCTEYCWECELFPCAKYDGIDKYDSFSTHKNQLTDIEKFKRIGAQAYHAEQRDKAELLQMLLADYNDGRKKTLFCAAVNLLEPDALKTALNTTESGAGFEELSQKEKSARVAEALQSAAKRSGVELKLRKKSK